MKIRLLAALTWLIFGSVATATGSQDVIFVEDYSSAAWNDTVSTNVAAFNVAMPKHGPKLVYVRRPETDCDDVPKRKKETKRIVICSMHDTRYAGYTIGHRISLPSDPTLHPQASLTPLGVICHEFMHVLIGIPDHDNDGYREISCVWGGLDHPGPFDVERLASYFGKHHATHRART